MDLKTYRNKVRGCWLGKNIGGSLGAPFECRRGVFDVDFYTHDISQGVLPNDDLDLQLIFLNAAERYGRNIDSEILGEYWLSYIVADWSEYGAAKNNLAMGLLPPVSGWYNNHNKNSCGSFIRSELWSCLMPGHPELAVKYAYEDAIVDHSEEGVYAEIFCAAMESAAFGERDPRKLMKIGLSYIPAESDTARAIQTAADCYDNGMTWMEARKKVLQVTPGTFGMYRGYEDREPEPDVPTGPMGYDAPSNIGLMIVGLLYGEGDFSKSICIAANCGEDADCTAATLGSLLGIIYGEDGIPQKWIEPIGDEIKTISLDLTVGLVRIPKSIEELTNRVCSLMPVFMQGYYDLLNEKGIEIVLNSSLYSGEIKKGLFASVKFEDTLKFQPFGIKKANTILEIVAECVDGIEISKGVEKKIRLYIENLIMKQQWLDLKWNIPDEWDVLPARRMVLSIDQAHGGNALSQFEFTLLPNEITQGKYDITLEISSNGRVSKLFIPITLIVR